MLLHTVTKSPARDPLLSTCLRLSLPGSAIVLLEDAVYAALDCEANHALLDPYIHDRAFFILLEDLTVRGIADKIMPIFTVLDMPALVKLTADCPKLINWT